MTENQAKFEREFEQYKRWHEQKSELNDTESGDPPYLCRNCIKRWPDQDRDEEDGSPGGGGKGTGLLINTLSNHPAI